MTAVPLHADVVLDASWVKMLRETTDPRAAPYLSKLLTNGESQHVPASALRGWRALLAFLWQCEMTGWQAAAYALAGEGAGELNGGEAEAERWWRADPVHLIAGLDHLRLAVAGQRLALTRADARHLLDTLAEHFSAETWHMTSPWRWYLRSSQPWRVEGVATDFALGGDLRHLMARGADAAAMAGLVTECQMLLADHEVNARRADQGLVTINSLWCWGGGEPTPTAPPEWWARLPSLISWDPELRGAWAAAGAAVELASDLEARARREALVGQLPRTGGVLMTLDHELIGPGEGAAQLLPWLEDVLAALLRRRGRAVRLVLGAQSWTLVPGWRSQRTWWTPGRPGKLADLLSADSRRDAHPWYSRGLRSPPLDEEDSS